MNKTSGNYLKSIFFVLFIISLISCAKMVSLEPEYVPLERSYKKIILQKFEVGKELEKEFPEAIVVCESTTMSELLEKNAAPIIEKTRLSSSKEANALIVKIRITTIKMASSSSRGVSGEFTGRSEMSAEVKLIDAQTRKILRKDNLSTANILSPASRAAIPERAIPAKLGKMIAEYIVRSIAGS